MLFREEPPLRAKFIGQFRKKRYNERYKDRTDFKKSFLPYCLYKIYVHILQIL